MYTLLILLLVGVSLALIGTGISSRKWFRIGSGGFVLLATLALFALMDFWAEMLWFEAIGYSGRFWTVIAAVLVASLLGAVTGGLAVCGITWPIPASPPVARGWPEAAGAIAGLIWGTNHWNTLLRYWYGVRTEVTDPILGRDTGFYLFTLPFYDALYGLLLTAAWISVLAAAVFAFLPRHRQEFEALSRQDMPGRQYRDYRGVYVALGGLALVLAVGQWLNIFHLMYSQWGVVSGPGWTDVTIRLPAHWVMVVSLLAAAVVLLVSPLVRRLHDWSTRAAPGWPLAAAWGPIVVVGGIWILALGIVPGLIQWLVVEPNEITREEPYIRHNIQFTWRGFQLDKVEEREFPVGEQFTQETHEQNKDLLSQVRLWDPRALVDVYKQFQEIRLYYEFPDVDIDRYTIDNEVRQVMVSPREMELANLPEQSQTFVNHHFQYTHGYGMTMAPVSEFTPDGLPDLLIKDLPPQSDKPELDIDRPAIYYGLLTDSYAVVNSEEKEFDYPRGEQNAYVRYQGQGGVQLSNLWRKFVYGWTLGGTRLLLSGYPTSESRIMFRRQVHKRVKSVAPFLKFDRDPYIVLAEGKMYWIVDAYTTSHRYPYSEPFFGENTATRGDVMPSQRTRYPTTAKGPPAQLLQANYVRNSVKAVVNAFDGSVDFYIFEPEDPLIRVWDRVFPGLLKPREAMPEVLLRHIRYPEDILLAQALVYAKYHMTDPSVFYNQEDLWVRATEKYYGSVQAVEPYYIMWTPPGADNGDPDVKPGGASKESQQPKVNPDGDTEFIQMLPFTPKNRQVLIGWIAGMCDPDNYGRLLAYRFPKEKRVLGTQQVETKIDQHRDLSQELTLWNQRGSNVIRGNVLVIPIGKTLLYVEPIYLQAEAAAYPELRLVVLMHNDQLSYAETFEQALKGLYGEPPGPKRPPGQEAGAALDRSVKQLVRKAATAFDQYVEALSEKRFQEAGQSLETLSQTLQELRTSAQQNEKSPPKQP